LTTYIQNSPAPRWLAPVLRGSTDRGDSPLCHRRLVRLVADPVTILLFHLLTSTAPGPAKSQLTVKFSALRTCTNRFAAVPRQACAWRFATATSFVRRCHLLPQPNCQRSVGNLPRRGKFLPCSTSRSEAQSWLEASLLVVPVS
jgi:hypothetical protein